MDKTFKFAGASRHKQQIKIRFANDISRVKVLSAGGHTEINLIELPNPMTKSQIGVYLKQINFANGNAEIDYAINELMIKHSSVVPLQHNNEELVI